MSDLRGEPAVVGVAGFRRFELLYSGPQLSLNDLSTRADFRGRGHARAPLAWLKAGVRCLGCLNLHLDSGVQRFPTHRLSLRFGFDISAHHFARRLT